MSGSATRHVRRQRDHALERLRERSDANASFQDLLAVEAIVREACKSGRGYRQPGSDCVVIGIEWAGRKMTAVFVPRFDCLRTVLPPSQKATLADVFPRLVRGAIQQGET